MFSSFQELQLLSKDTVTLLRQWDHLVKQDGVFMYHHVFHPDGTEESLQLILPSILKGEVLTGLHQEYGHQGVGRTIELVWER